MRLLLIHQNFPGQFRQLVPFLLDQGHDLIGIGSHQRPIPTPIRLLRYAEPAPEELVGQGGVRLWDEALKRARQVALLCADLAKEGWQPDRILAHSGWGETLALRDVWPDVPVVLWPELWISPEHGGHGPDPYLPASNFEHQLDQLGRNSLTRLAMHQASAWVLPTQYQAEGFPADLRCDPRMQVVHEGIDTAMAHPDPNVQFEVRGIPMNRSNPTITFVNRNLERLRGFDTLMRALPAIQAAHPTVRVLIVGDSGAGYRGEAGLRQLLLEELAGRLDLDRIHFLGRIPYPTLLALLQASWVHVYLSYPYVLGWSMLEAMACGCCVVGSAGRPVDEVIEHGVNGLLVPLDLPDQLAAAILKPLTNGRLRKRLGEAARQTALSWDVGSTQPRLEQLIAAAVPPTAGQLRPR